MEARKWEELPRDCLGDVFGRVGAKSLLVDIPFVCKSWYKATLIPNCWKQLDFPDLFGQSLLSPDPFVIRFKRHYRLQEEIGMTEFVKFVVDRSGGCATMVKLPACYQKEALAYVADNCPALKKLVLQSKVLLSSMLALSFGKFKNLESLEFSSGLPLKDIVTKFAGQRQSFFSLIFLGVASKVYIGNEEVMAIVTCLPKIKCLSLREVYVERENLIRILKGCVELVRLDVRDCIGFDLGDEELRMLASHIPVFECSHSRLFLDTFHGYNF